MLVWIVMKRLLYSALLLLTLSAFANALTIVSPCFVVEAPNSGPLLSNACSVTATPGFFIDSVTVTLTSDYTGWVDLNPVVTATYAFTVDTAGFGAIPNGVVTTTLSGSPQQGNSNPVVNMNTTLNGNFGSSVVERFNMSNTVAGGDVLFTSGKMTISATESPSPTPEPATLGLIGSALLGLGFLLRKKRT
jgi:hypothetical protein